MADPLEHEIVHREIDTSESEPGVEISKAVADLEETDTTELTSIWGCTDHVLDHLFSDPPSPEAQMEIKFSYEGYRISVDQDGSARFVKITD